MILSPSQQRAYDAVAKWLRHREEPIFWLAGYAGTGKTTIAKMLADQADGRVEFAAYTGKAAAVMRSAGMPKAKTIHSLIYEPVEKGRTHLAELKEALAKATEAGDKKEATRLEREVAKEEERLQKPGFRMREALEEARGAALIVVDEWPMVGARIEKDLLALRVPILALGDPGQLQPVGDRASSRTKPDAILEEVHRQALDSPILALATEIREKRRRPMVGNYGTSSVVLRKDGSITEALDYDQVLVGLNVTRNSFNARVRKRKSYESATPLAGERMVCLRNDHDIGILNGETYVVTEDAIDLVDGDDSAFYVMRLEGKTDPLTAWREALWAEMRRPYWERKEAQEFAFGYALTTHKAQGSQWPSVYVVDESRTFRDDWWRWLYTAVTRASERVKILL